MTELKRWLDDDDAPDEVRKLLGAGRRSLPLPGAVQQRSARRVAGLAALPVGFAALVTSSGTVFAAAAGMSLGIAVAVGGPALLETSPARNIAPVAAPGVAPRAPVTRARETAPAPATPPATKPTPSAISGRSVHDSLTEETELLERSRAMLGTNPSGALALVQEHAKRFPRGKLAIERQLIEVDGLQRSGRVAEARARIAVLQSKLEGSIYEPRLKQLAAQSQRKD
jgi:hypothetical protein